MSSPLVLVVDDDADILDAICEILDGEGYRVARARHGLEALASVQREEPSLILLDLMMPVMDGLGFAQTLRQRGLAPCTPIVVISADGNPQHATDVGARGYLAKPFDLEALLSQVSRMTAPSAPGGPS